MTIRKILTAAAAIALAVPLMHAQDTSAPQKLNKKDLVVKEWNTIAGSHARTLDRLTTYSPEGKKIEEVEYDNAGKQKWRKRYEWGENGKVSRELVYDERNRLVTIKKFEYNEFGKKKTQYNYNAKGKLLTTKTFEYVTQDA